MRSPGTQRRSLGGPGARGVALGAPRLDLGAPRARPDSKNNDFAATVAYFNEFWVPPGCSTRARISSVSGFGGGRGTLYNVLALDFDLLYTSTTAICDSFSSRTAPTHLKVRGRIHDACGERAAR